MRPRRCVVVVALTLLFLTFVIIIIIIENEQEILAFMRDGEATRAAIAKAVDRLMATAKPERMRASWCVFCC